MSEKIKIHDLVSPSLTKLEYTAIAIYQVKIVANTIAWAKNDDFSFPIEGEMNDAISEAKMLLEKLEQQ